MRWIGIIVAVVTIGGCSCGRNPDADTRTAASAQTHSNPAMAAANAGGNLSAPPAAAPSVDAATLAGLTAAGSTVQRYLGALPGAARTQADALWVGGRPPPVPDDAALRAIGGIVSMRILNDPPRSLDPRQPLQRVEVPVRILVRTTSGSQQLNGTYRLQPRPGGDDWEIYSATLQPVLR